jgi:hypothetical protein
VPPGRVHLESPTPPTLLLSHSISYTPWSQTRYTKSSSYSTRVSHSHRCMTRANRQRHTRVRTGHVNTTNPSLYLRSHITRNDPFIRPLIPPSSDLHRPVPPSPRTISDKRSFSRNQAIPPCTSSKGNRCFYPILDLFF